MKLSPNEGGCWFCSQDGTDNFDTEFDTYVHIACVQKAIEQFMQDGRPTEALHMDYLLTAQSIALPDGYEEKKKQHFEASDWDGDFD